MKSKSNGQNINTCDVHGLVLLEQLPCLLFLYPWASFSELGACCKNLPSSVTHDVKCVSKFLVSRE